MSLFGDIARGMANSFIDDYDKVSRKSGKGGLEYKKEMHDFINGKVDFNGNPINRDDDDDDDDY